MPTTGSSRSSTCSSRIEFSLRDYVLSVPFALCLVGVLFGSLRSGLKSGYWFAAIVCLIFWSSIVAVSVTCPRRGRWILLACVGMALGAESLEVYLQSVSWDDLVLPFAPWILLTAATFYRAAHPFRSSAQNRPTKLAERL